MFICLKMDLALNNLQWFICHKTKANQTSAQCQPFNSKVLSAGSTYLMTVNAENWILTQDIDQQCNIN